MARPPKDTRLKEASDAKSVSDNFKSIGDALDDTRVCLQQGLTVAENVKGCWIDVTFQAPVTSAVRAKTSYKGQPLTTRPRGVFLAGFWQTRPSFSEQTLPSTFSWSFDDGYISTNAPIGITGTGTYQMSLLVLTE